MEDLETLTVEQLFGLAAASVRQTFDLKCCPSYHCEPYWHGETCYWVFTRDYVGPYKAAGDKSAGRTPKEALIKFIQDIRATPMGRD